MQPGDLLVFDGGDHSDVAHLVTDFLSNAIQVVSHSNLTHSAMVYQVPTQLIESTILNGKSGPQLHDIAERIQSYPGRVWLLSLNPTFRKCLQFDAMWKLADQKLQGDKYNIGELLKYVGRKIPIVSYIPALYKSDAHAEVCSELVAQLLQAGGMAGLRPATMTPQSLAELRIYDTCTQLCGAPASIRNFNTV